MVPQVIKFSDFCKASPSLSIDIINQRLDLIDWLLKRPVLREDITTLLRQTFDSQRLVQKFSLGRGDPDDLLSLFRTIKATQAIADVLEKTVKANVDGTSDSKVQDSLIAMISRLSLQGPAILASRIAEAVDESGLEESHQSQEIENAAMISLAKGILDDEGSAEDFNAMSQVVRSKFATKRVKDVTLEEQDVWIMRRNASPTMEKLHNDLVALHQEKYTLTDTLRERMGAQTLTLKWTPGLGHICHTKGVKDVQASMGQFGSAKNASSTKSTRSFYVSEWSNLGGRIDQMKYRIRGEEQQVFQRLREQVIVNLVKLRRNAAVLDEFDLACSSAVLAEEQGLIRPILNYGTSHKIIAGRHPTVKLGLEEQGRSFVSNDCFVGDKSRIWLITGPNMAGKSTFLRQNALISVIAQVGSFIPAQHAEIGIVDHVFSRIGSADNLYRDQSTFMVEMLETASILRHATRRSFVIMDEVGRGTTSEDGLAVGFACLHHLYHVNGCRTLFATHFHALADMTRAWDGLECYCTDVLEGEAGGFSYVHRLALGVNRQSHALKVAKLAGEFE